MVEYMIYDKDALWSPKELWAKGNGCYSFCSETLLRTTLTIVSKGSESREYPNVTYFVLWKAWPVFKKWVSTHVGAWDTVTRGGNMPQRYDLWKPGQGWKKGHSCCSLLVLEVTLRIWSSGTKRVEELWRSLPGNPSGLACQKHIIIKLPLVYFAVILTLEINFFLCDLF